MADGRLLVQRLLPTRIDQPGLLNLQHIAAEGQTHQIGFRSIDHGPALGTGAAMTGFDDHALAALLLPVRFELRSDLVVGRLGDGVADQEDLLGAADLGLGLGAWA